MEKVPRCELLRFCSIRRNERTEAGLAIGERIVAFSVLNENIGTTLPRELLAAIRENTEISGLNRTSLAALTEGNMKGVLGDRIEQIDFEPPFRDPPKIWGIGLNYKSHAEDLDAVAPFDEPASFMKPRTTIIGPNDTIILPKESKRVTAEAEFGLIVGKACKNVKEADYRSVIFGYVPIIDMTAEDILRRNPRFLTRSKSFDTFFSFGPFVLTPDEIPELGQISISTVLNGEVIKSNKIAKMIFSPSQLVSFHSHGMTLEAGDIISTGTPGAVPVKDGDVVECRITGFPVLSNHVRGS